MSQDVCYELRLVKEQKRIIEELEEHGIVFTSLTEQEISVLNIGKEVVVLENWLGSRVSMLPQLDTNGIFI